MPSKARIQKLQLQSLIGEQKRDAERHHVFSEKITPRKPDSFGEYLTPRQEAILRLSFKGMCRRKIAQAFRISPATVTTLRKDALKRLPSRVQAALSKNHQERLKSEDFSEVPALRSPLTFDEDGEEDSVF